MKVKELIDLLKKLPQDAIVLLSSDDDGNFYSPLDINNGYASGNFDTDNYPECFTNDMYNMSQDEMHGDYIILYPR